MFFDVKFCRCVFFFFFFFFFKQKTAYEMRISDWSSDVCSSDLYGHDLGFEKIIAKAAKNIYLTEVQKIAHSFFEEAWNSGGFIPRKAEERNVQHKEIIEAIKNKKPDLAVALMKKHMSIKL